MYIWSPEWEHITQQPHRKALVKLVKKIILLIMLIA